MNYWKDRPVFVTGGAGFLGGWLVRALADRGAAVTCLVRDWTPGAFILQPGLVNRVKIVRGDVREQRKLERVINECEAATVFHLAAQTIVGTANRLAESTFATNVMGTVALLEACRRAEGLECIVVASSDKAYGYHDSAYTEGMPLNGIYPYDCSKACEDRIAQCYRETWDMPIAITRCANLFGGGDRHYNRLIPGTIRSVLRGEKPVIRSDGTMVRDYLYVEDAVEGYLTLAGSGLEGPFNLGGQSMAVTDVVQAICSASGAPQEWETLGEASNEIPAQRLDDSLITQLLGWGKRSFSDALAPTLAWYRENLT